MLNTGNTPASLAGLNTAKSAVFSPCALALLKPVNWLTFMPFNSLVVSCETWSLVRALIWVVLKEAKSAALRWPNVAVDILASTAVVSPGTLSLFSATIWALVIAVSTSAVLNAPSCALVSALTWAVVKALTCAVVMPAIAAVDSEATASEVSPTIFSEEICLTWALVRTPT